MSLEQLASLLAANESILKELARTHRTIIGNSSSSLSASLLNSQNEQTLREIRTMISTVRENPGAKEHVLRFAGPVFFAKSVSWNNLMNNIETLNSRVDIQKNGFEALEQPIDQLRYSHQAFAYHQALSSLNTALKYVLGYLAIKQNLHEHSRENHLAELVKKVDDCIKTFSARLQLSANEPQQTINDSSLRSQ